MARFHTLQQWLDWQETLHPKSIDLGLERVATVAGRMQCRVPAPVVISVAGTNGKGSCVAFLDSIFRQAGYRVGCYTSPHLRRYNERIRLQGKAVSDALICEAFARVDAARDGVSLTYFEFGTLAALDIMCREALDVAVLEVGLGGRLDAVNVVDADVALLTNVGLDHTEWLGSDLESIGREKAGIFRSGRPAVIGTSEPPQSVLAEAGRIGARLSVAARDFTFHRQGRHWNWRGQNTELHDLPLPVLGGGHQLVNASAVLAVVEQLSGQLRIDAAAIRAGLQQTSLPGRVETVPGKLEQVLDVSHNAHAADVLAKALAGMPRRSATRAVIGMMADKDAAAYAGALAAQVDHWYPVGLATARAYPVQALSAQLETIAAGSHIHPCGSMSQAIQNLRRDALPGERILVCGSFYTVAEWLALQPHFDDK